MPTVWPPARRHRRTYPSGSSARFSSPILAHASHGAHGAPLLPAQIERALRMRARMRIERGVKDVAINEGKECPPQRAATPGRAEGRTLSVGGALASPGGVSSGGPLPRRRLLDRSRLLGW